jgi:hypothetical protein
MNQFRKMPVTTKWYIVSGWLTKVSASLMISCLVTIVFTSGVNTQAANNSEKVRVV